MAAIVVVFAFLSQRTAKLFRRFRPLTAYTLDISGSCAGILSFMLISFLGIPAWVWFGAFSVALLVPMADRPRTRFLSLVPGVAAALIAWHADARLAARPEHRGRFEVFWSPYQRVEYRDLPGDPMRILVNGISHQNMEPAERIRSMFYETLHRARRADGRLGPYHDVLVLGAGSGNDVQAALMNGAERVDAVEIDPVIADLGKRHHPERPYDDPRVTLTVDDGRAFMTRTRRRYDLVVFALTDSVVKVSSMSQLRLENYLFTVESVRRAYHLLREGGDLVFYNFYRLPWLRTKIEEMVWRVTAARPSVVYENKDFAVLVGRKRAPAAAVPGTGAPLAGIDLPTDDAPFLYLRTRGIPTVYGWAMLGMCLFVGIVGLSLHLATRRRAQYGGPGTLPVKLAFALMGVAFLLLETKSVIQFSLLFGTTWLNSSLVFLAVLLLVLAANWAATRLRGERSRWTIFGLLVLSTLLPLAIPLGGLLHVESSSIRFVLASLMTFSPIFFANLVFSITFRDVAVAEHVFGWNLIGATVGGVAEYSSMLLGYSRLALIVALCYVLVLVLLVLARRARVASAVRDA